MSQSLDEKILSADPAPLGLAGFAFTTFLLSFANIDVQSPAWFTPNNTDIISVVIALAFFYGGMAQLIAGLFEMRKGNTFGFTAFCSYGAFWLFFAFLQMLVGMKIVVPTSTASLDSALGLALILWGFFTLYMWVPAMYSNLALNLTFLFLWIAFFLLGTGFYGGNLSLIQLGGYSGLLTALFAAYASFAIVTNSVWGKILPLGPGIKNLLGRK